MSLSAIEKKLDTILEKSAQTKESAPKTAEELDEERLKEIEAKLVDLTELLAAKATRESLDRDIDTHRERVATTVGESRPYTQVYHEHKGGKKIPTTRRTSSKMQLVDSLKMRLRVSKHPKDLEHALHILVQEQLEILERQLKRARTGP